MSLAELARRFPDDAAAGACFINVRRQDGAACPSCGPGNVRERLTRTAQPFRCCGCREDFPTGSGAQGKDPRLDLQVRIMQDCLHSSSSIKGASSTRLHRLGREPNVAQRSAWHLAQRVREACKDSAGPPAGPAECDETCIGGRRGKVSNPKRRQSRKGEAGHWPFDRTTAAGTRDRRAGKATAKAVARNDRETLQGIAREGAGPGSKACTDGAKARTGADGRARQAVNRPVLQHVSDMAHANEAGSLQPMFRRGWHGTFRRLSPQRPHGQANGLAGRHDGRRPGAIGIMSSHMAKGLQGRKLPCTSLVAS